MLRSGRDQAVLDVGPIGPRHLYAHAHADVLSFVLWADGRPVLIDPGTFQYTGPWRDHFRSTAAHSTVEVDGLDQCEFWGDFRAARTPRVSVAPPEGVAGATLVNAAHDGYRRLADPVIHRRTFAWIPGDGIVVVDRLECGGPHSIRSTLRPAAGLAEDGPLRIGALTVGALGRELPPISGRITFHLTSDPCIGRTPWSAGARSNPLNRSAGACSGSPLRSPTSTPLD